jgi:hypothetical protein
MGSNNDRSAFETAADALQTDVTAAAAMATHDANVRLLYQRTIQNLVEQLRSDAQAQRISWTEAAQAASEARNNAMELLRGRSSPIGLAMAQQMKAQGKTLNELVARYTTKQFGPSATFDALSDVEKNQIYGEIVAAAGRANPRVNMMMRTASRIGRGLLVLSLAVSIYEVATSDDPWDTAKREAAVTAGGIAAAALGGAMAGLACGPGAPICVTAGAFIFGALAAAGIDYMW